MPDVRYPVEDNREGIREMFVRFLGRVWTSMPTVVKQWDYAGSGSGQTHTVSATPAVKGRQLMTDGTYQDVQMPDCTEVPVLTIGGGGIFLTHPIAAQDEGLTLFASRCIDTFWKNGGIQASPDYGRIRKHHLADGMFISGKLSDKNKLQAISKTSGQLRTTDGKAFIELTVDGKSVNIATSLNAKITIGNGNTLIFSANSLSVNFAGGGFFAVDKNGNLEVSGTITADKEIITKLGNIHLSTHTHAQDNDSDDDVEEETEKPTGGS